MTAPRDTQTDWAAIARPVAEALLGEPNRRLSRRTEYRYGQRGSLRVDLQRGTWNDFEAGEGGGVLDLVKRERRCDTTAALQWLQSQGLLDERTPTQPPRESPARASQPTPDRDEEHRARFAAALWDRAVPADDTPARRYLARRRAWPPRALGAPLPPTVRWLARTATPPRDETLRWYGLPRSAVGALVCAWTNPQAPNPRAVSLEALTARGEHLAQRWRRTYGPRAGRVFVAREAPTGAAVHIAEGELDALALVHAPWTGAGQIVAAGGTSGLPGAAGQATGPVTIHADGDRGGRTAALTASETARAAGHEARIQWYTGDPADRLAHWLTERIALHEHHPRHTRREAALGAWRELMRTNVREHP